MRSKAFMIGLVGAALLAAPAFPGDDHDTYHHMYGMCTRIVKNQHRDAPISIADTRKAVRYCLGHATRYF